MSSLGLDEATYTRLTYDLTLAAARAMVAVNPVLGPLVLAIARILGRGIVTTATIGDAMLAVSRHGYSKPVLEPADILAAAREPATSPPPGV